MGELTGKMPAIFTEDYEAVLEYMDAKLQKAKV